MSIEQEGINQYFRDITKSIKRLADRIRVLEANEFASTGGGATVDHGALSGLGDDDHAQYFLADGTRAMSGNMDMDENDLLDINNIAFKDDIEVTINAESITVSQFYHRVDTEGDAASDDLDTIAGVGNDGQLLILHAENDARTVVVKNGTGNIYVPSGSDITLDEYDYHIFLIYDAESSQWCVIGESGGGDADAIHDNVAGEINAIAEKASPVNADLIIIEDSENSYNKKGAQLDNLPGVGNHDTSAASTSDPPTAPELTTAFGDPSIKGDGYVGLLDIGGAGTDVFLVASNGSKYFYEKLTGAEEAFTYYKELVIDHTKVDANLTDWPLTVIISSDNDLRTVANGGHVENTDMNGGITGSLEIPADLVFSSDQNGLNKLSFEFEDYDPTTGEIVAHVKIPSVSSSLDTTIYIAYGKSSITTSQENITDVWSNAFVNVFHFAEPSGDFYNSATGTSITDTISATGKTGKIGDGQEFDGTDDKLDLLDFGDIQNYTLGAWLNPDNWTPSNYKVFFCDGASQGGILSARLGNGNSNFEIGGGSGIGVHLSKDVSGVSGYQQFVMTQKRSTDIREGFWNGSSYDTYTDSGIGDLTGNAAAIGYNKDVGGRYWDGLLDEYRLASIIRSDGWISTTFANQDSPNTFYSIGAEQTN